MAGAAIDVFESEPPVGSPLLEVDKIVLTPHLGASTAEAQVKVAVDVAQQVLDVLAGKPARSAVNVIPVSAELLRRQEPYLLLAEKLGRLQGQLAEGPLTAVELIYAGELAEEDSRMLTRAFLKGLLQPILDFPVNIVNSALIAQQRGLKVTESRSTEMAEYVSLVTRGCSPTARARRSPAPSSAAASPAWSASPASRWISPPSDTCWSPCTSTSPA